MRYAIAVEPDDDKRAFGVAVPDLPGCFSAIVEIDPEDLSDAVERVNITLAKRLLMAMDRYAAARGETRSGFLARAALETMARD